MELVDYWQPFINDMLSIDGRGAHFSMENVAAALRIAIGDENLQGELLQHLADDMTFVDQLVGSIS